MKILLINPQYTRGKAVFPLGLGYLAAVLKQHHHDIEVLDIDAENLTKSQVVDRIKTSDHDLYGLTGMITVYEYVHWLSWEIRRFKPESKIILGGGMATTIPEHCLETMPLNALVYGEGEITAPELISAFENKTSLTDIRGVWFRIDGQTFANNPRPRIKDLDVIPFPAYELFPMEKYGNIRAPNFKNEMVLLSSRGCPFQCTFCRRNFGNEVTFRSIDNVIKEIEYLREHYAVDFITLLDECFVLKKARVMEFCDRLEALPYKVLWSCSGRVGLVNRPMLDRMAGANCVGINYGIESGSDEILGDMRKGVNAETQREALEMSRAAGLSVMATIMLGYPNETRDTVKDTIELFNGLGVMPNPLFFATPYPGTELYDNALAEGKVTADLPEYLRMIGDNDISKLSVNLTSMSDIELIGLKIWADNKIRSNFRETTHPARQLVHEFADHVRHYGVVGAIRTGAGKVREVVV